MGQWAGVERGAESGGNAVGVPVAEDTGGWRACAAAGLTQRNRQCSRGGAIQDKHSRGAQVVAALRQVVAALQSRGALAGACPRPQPRRTLEESLASSVLASTISPDTGEMMSLAACTKAGACSGQARANECHHGHGQLRHGGQSGWASQLFVLGQRPTSTTSRMQMLHGR